MRAGCEVVDARVHYATPGARMSDHAALAATFEVTSPQASPLIVPAGSLAMNRFTAGNSVTLLRSGAEYFPALTDAIANAEREIWLETYIFADDETGRAVADALDRAPRSAA